MYTKGGDILMKNKLLYAGLAGVFALTTVGGVVLSKKWVDQRIEDRVSEYEKKDKKWTSDEILRYEEKDKKYSLQLKFFQKLN